jgi:hypothetical protein
MRPRTSTWSRSICRSTTDAFQRHGRCSIVRQGAQAEPGSSLATRLPHHEAELAGESRNAGAHGRAPGSFAVNSRRRDKHEGQSGGCYGSTQLEIVALRRSWREIFLWKTGDTHKKRKGGEKRRTYSRCHCDVVRDQQQKGDISKELTMGTFLMSFDRHLFDAILGNRESPG